MTLQDDVRNLARNPTLSDIDPEGLRLIAFSGETRILRKGDVLFRIGDPSDGGYVVFSGTIALEGRGGALILEPPALIGDAALIAETICQATATAREPSSVLRISRALFHRVLSEYPDSAARLHRTLTERLKALAHDLDSVRTGSLRELDEGHGARGVHPD
jgi:CRP-like cAMP-binding protein